MRHLNHGRISHQDPSSQPVSERMLSARLSSIRSLPVPRFANLRAALYGTIFGAASHGPAAHRVTHEN